MESDEKDGEKLEKSENLNAKMNGNGNYYGGYYPNRYLPFACSSSQTAPAPPSPSNYGKTGIQMSDTVVVAGDDLSNVPAAIIVQLEKANRTIASQSLEIERLKSHQNGNVEVLLRKQLNDLEKEVRGSRERFLEQQELLAEMSREMENLMREKQKMAEKFEDLEKKYKKTKMATKELARILENDEEILQEASTSSLYKKSRFGSENSEKSELYQRILVESENLHLEIDRERRLTESLHEDLARNRRLVIDRDESIEELRAKLGKAESAAVQCETDLSRTSTDLALERARCDALTLELHELDQIFGQTQSTVQAFAVENEQLEEKYREAHKTIMTLNAKLEAQGLDLVTTKRHLRNLNEKQRSGPPF